MGAESVVDSSLVIRLYSDCGYLLGIERAELLVVLVVDCIEVCCSSKGFGGGGGGGSFMRLTRRGAALGRVDMEVLLVIPP